MRWIHRWSVVFCAVTLLVAVVYVVSPVHALAVTTISQVGADIDGETAGDLSGYSVALSGDGSRIAIGAYGNDDNGSNAGHVRVYTLVSGTWTQTGADIDGETAGDLSGHSVALSGDGSRIAIGAYLNDGNGSDAGHVRVYTLISGTWTQTGLDIDGEAVDDVSGRSVVMSGDGSRIAIGALGNDGTGSSAGHVRVYTLINGTWTQTGVDIDGETAVDFSGYSVALSGDGSRIAIGAPTNDGTGINAGHVRIYTLINGTWTQTGADIDGETADDASGYSVALSGDGSRIAIGASDNDGNGSNAGHVRVYGVPTVPVAPTITSVVGTNGSLSVSFVSGADGGSPITNYKYSMDGTNYIALNPLTTSSPFIISGLTNATTYSVTIKAVNVYGDSLKSNTLSGTPIAPAAIVEPTTTVAVTTTTTIAAVVVSSTKKVTVTKNELPETGTDSFPLVALAMGLLSAGLVVTTRKRFARR